jgi:CRP-like cAMP-binding protein
MPHDHRAVAPPIPHSPIENAQTLSLEKDRLVFRASDSANAIYRIVTGEVHLLRHAPNGAAIVLYRARAGDYFAEASLFSRQYHCDAVCVQPGICLRLPAKALRRKLRDDPVFALEWIAALSRNLLRQRSAQERLALKGARARIEHYLVERGEDGCVTLDQPLNRWAKELGISHEALYRTLSSMEKEGVLARKGGMLRLLAGKRRI